MIKGLIHQEGKTIVNIYTHLIWHTLIYKANTNSPKGKDRP